MQPSRKSIPNVMHENMMTLKQMRMTPVHGKRIGAKVYQYLNPHPKKLQSIDNKNAFYTISPQSSIREELCSRDGSLMNTDEQMSLMLINEDSRGNFAVEQSDDEYKYYRNS